MNSFRIVFRVLPFVLILSGLKFLIIYLLGIDFYNFQCFELSEISVVFTGGFFVMGMMLAGTLSDLKESEKIPGELATSLDIIKDIIVDSSNQKHQNHIQFLHESTGNIIKWLKDKEKHSMEIFSVLESMNTQIKPENKDLEKRFFDQMTNLRKLINRTYIISRTDFAKPAYILQRSIVTIICILLLLCSFKTFAGAMVVTFCLTFIFFYLLFFVREMDNPFLNLENRNYVDYKVLENVHNRIGDLLAQSMYTT